MTATSDRLQPLIASARETQSRAVGAAGELADDATVKPSFERFGVALDRIEALSALVDDAYTSEAMVTTVAGAITQATASLEQVAGGEPVGTAVAPVSSAVETILNTVPLWPIKDASKTKVADVAQQFGAALEQRLQPLQTQVTALTQQVDGLSSTITAARSELEADRNTQVTAVRDELAALQNAAAAVAESVKAQQERVDGVVATFQQQFTDAQEKRSQEHRTQLQVEKEADGGRAKEAEEAIKALQRSSEASAKGLITSITTMRDQAGDLVRLITTAGTAGGFGKEREAQAKLADWWRLAAIALAIVAAAASYSLLEISIGHALTNQQIAGRLAVVGLLLGVAGYAARQSGQHRRREVAARRIELALTALEPFIAGLSTEEKAAMRKLVAGGVFDLTTRADDEEQTPAITDDTLTLLGHVRDLVVPPK